MSFAPILRGEGAASRDEVVVYDEYGPVRMVRTHEWKYVHRYPYGPHELYDLANDPDEKENLADAHAHVDRIAEMRSRLESWFVKYVNPDLDGTREPVTGKGQLDLAGAAGGGRQAFAKDWHYLQQGERPGYGPPPSRSAV